MDGLLTGKVAVVSGVGPGLGRAIATRLAGEGADMVLAARRLEPLQQLAAELEASGSRAVAVPTDITSPTDCQRLADTAGAWQGRVDILVNNAFAEEPWHNFTGFDVERWHLPFEVNVFGTLQLTQAMVPGLKAAGGGSIVMITTLSVRNVNPVLGGYAASKGSLTAAARALAVELGPHRIRVNCVAPGHIWGESLQVYFEWQAARRGIGADEVYREVAGQAALGHIATPEEIAGPVAWFASDRSRVLTGQTLDVNCGRTVG
jgi:NAD(P)-dependent dehydrogenase (short-subunit alcohol dehydrogenase family)